MDYKEALKKAQAHKPKENLVMVTISYGDKLVFNYKEGMAFLAALQSAEVFKEDYTAKRKRITSMTEGSVRCSLMSRTEYEQIKISQLLDLPLEDVQQHNLELS